MIIIRNGDILNSECQTIINPTNTVGVMGNGLALKFKNKYPEMYNHYKIGCDSGLFVIGKPYIYKINDQKWIMNFPTKKHWKNPSKIEYIIDGLKYILKNYKKAKITSLAVPALGCGLGGLNPNEVYYYLNLYLSEMEIPVELYWNFKI